MKVTRHFTAGLQSPYDGLDFETRTSIIRNPDGSVVFESPAVVPSGWSQVATDIIAQKYFRKAGVPAATKRVKEKGVPEWLQRSVADDKALAGLDEGERFGGETDSRQVFDRLCGTWTYWATRRACSTPRRTPRPSSTSSAT